MAIAQVLGQFAFGYVSDTRIPVSTLAIVASTVATLATFALWGTAKSLGLLLAFSLVYGLFAYGFSTMRVAMGRAVSDDPSAAVTTYSILAFLQGFGNVLVGPISAALLSKRIRVQEYGAERYKELVVFTGSCLFASALIISAWHILRFFKMLV